MLDNIIESVQNDLITINSNPAENMNILILRLSEFNDFFEYQFPTNKESAKISLDVLNDLKKIYIYLNIKIL